MTDEEFEAYLKDRYFDQRDFFDRRSGDYKRYFTWTQVLIILFGAISPVLVALSKVIAWDWWIALPIIASFIVAVAAGLQTAFKYQEIWIRYRGTVQTLERIKARFDGAVGSYDVPDVTLRRKKFVEQIERILASETNAWVNSFDGPGDEG